MVKWYKSNVNDGRRVVFDEISYKLNGDKRTLRPASFIEYPSLEEMKMKIFYINTKKEAIRARDFWKNRGEKHV